MSTDGEQSIARVIGNVSRALVPDVPETEIQQRVCEQFARSELYSIALIGPYNPETGEVSPDASAGIAEDAFDGISDTGGSPLPELATEAVRTREVTVGQDLVDDSPSGAWREHALNHDYRSCAFVPLVYEESRYGILHLATDRPDGFGPAERESLGEVGTTIAYALETAESPASAGSTERERAETDLTNVTDETEPGRERRLYETIISSTPDLVYAFDLDYRFIFANEALLEMWGSSLEESMGKTLRETGYEPWHAEMHEREIDRVVETKEPIRGEVGFEHSELGHRIYDYIFAPVFDDQGDVEAIAGTTRDITERKETEEALQQSKERFRALVNASSDVVYRMSPDWSEMQRLEGQEFVADTHEPTSDWLDKYIHPDDQEWVLDAIDEAIETRSTIDLEHRVTQVDGSLGWTHLRAVPMLDEDGEIVEWLGMATDITERKAYERQLEESERRYRTLVEHFPNGAVGLFDEDLRYRIAGGGLLEEVGASAEEIVGQTVWERYPDELAERMASSFRAALDGEMNTFELEFHDRQWLATTLPVEDEAGEVSAGMVVVQDITKRKERERELEESRQRYRTLVENVPNGAVGMVDEDLRYVTVGGEPRTDETTTANDLEGQPIREVLSEDLADVIVPRYEAALEGESSTFEYEHESDDRYSRFHTFPLRDEDREVFGAIGMSQDITERKKHERELEKSNERLEQFAYAASHDLQEPLRMVSSYLQLIEQRYTDALDEEGREFIAFAVDGADRMREMIEGLLEYSRVDTHGDPFEPVDLNEVLRAVRDDLQVAIEETGAEIDAAELPRVMGDAGQLRQLFQNLLDNAIEYSGDDPPRMQISAEEANGGEEWVIAISDEGIGIDPGDTDRVFEVFQSLHSEDGSDGTGIGLALCERIVDRHGGDIWVDSEPREGATVCFTLPAVSSR
jgi:PAS domain S-box-containing protein